MKGLFALCLISLMNCDDPARSIEPPDPLSVGARIYHRRCSTCHQLDGSGRIRGNLIAADFTTLGGVLSKPDEELRRSILLGKDGQYGRMQAFKPILSPEEVDLVLVFIRTQFGSTAQGSDDRAIH